MSSASTPNLPAPRRRARLATPSLSLLVSLALHAGLLALAAAIVWHTAVAPPTHPAAHLLTLETPGDAAPAAGVSTPNTPPEAARPIPQPTTGSAAEIVLEPPPAAPEPQPLRGLTSAPDPSEPQSPTAAPAAPASGALPGLSTLLNPGASGETGTQIHAAVPGIADGPESVVFAGLGASSVKSVVYVVDASGPMVTSLPMVIAEVERSISRLSPTQKFGVILFRRSGEGAAAYEAFAPTLLRPTPSARKLLHDWLARIEPSGRSSPLVGLEAALALRPDAVFLLSRSIQRSGGGVWDLGLDATLARLDQLNPVVQGNRRDVLIQTIQFLDEDPTGIMPAIGEAHGGGRGYRVIRSQKDLAPTTTP